MSLVNKVKVIKANDGREPPTAGRVQGISKAQVESVLKRRAAFVEALEENPSGSRKQI